VTDALNAPTIEAPAPEAVAAAVTAKSRVCPECSGEFEPPAKGPGQHKRFCSTSCRTTWGNREKAQGAVAVTILKIWRTFRGSGEIGRAAFAELCSIADALLDDDRKAGRPALKSKEIEPFVRAILADRYIDRRRGA